MNDELVKRIWECASGECFNCSQYTPTTNASVCSKELMKQAADAIEELQKDRDMYLEGLTKEHNKAAHLLFEKEHQWTSVKEHLPEKPYGCLLLVWDSPYDGGDDFLNYLPRFAGWDGERWNDSDGQQVPFEVEYWMPLPEPPKEGT